MTVLHMTGRAVALCFGVLPVCGMCFIKLVCGVGQDVLEERAEMGMTDKIGGAASDDGGQETDTGAAGDVALARLE